MRIFCRRLALFVLLTIHAETARTLALGPGEWHFAASGTVPGFAEAGQPGRHTPAVAAIGGETGKVLVHGGKTSSGIVGDLICIDLVQSSATILPQGTTKPSARHFHGAEWVSGYFTTCQGFGGVNLGDCWKFNLNSNTWTKLTNVTGVLPVVRFAGTSVDAASRFFLTFGGRSSSGLTNALWRVEVSGVGTAEQITNAGAIPSAREGTVFVRKGETDIFLLLGGSGGVNEVYQLELSGLGGSWAKLTDAAGWGGTRWGIGMWDPIRNVALFGFGYSSSETNSIYVSGGTGANWTLLIPDGTIPTARDRVGYASVELANGAAALFGIGGRDGNWHFSDAFLLIESPMLGPNLTVGVPLASCNASLFNETEFTEELSAAFQPERYIDPADIVVLEAQCVGNVLEVTFAIYTLTGGSVPLPLTLSGGGDSGNVATYSGTTWTVINWPGYTTGRTSFTGTTIASAQGSVSGSSGFDSNLFVVAGLAVGGLICFLATAGFLFWKKRVEQNNFRTQQHEDIPLSALQVTAVKLLGSGNFGAVYEGRVDGTSKRIAIKEVRSGDSDETQREVDMLMRCQHEFVVQLLGVVGSNAIAVAPGCPALGGSVCMLTELCEYGSLQDALQRAKSGLPNVAVLSLETVSASWLLLVFWQVSEAMQFLTREAKVLHRDLAARNVLLARASDGYASGLSNSDGLGICARVSDFGLSESMYADHYDKQQGGAEALPLRWTAPEALLKHKFSEKSDVYSFGVLLIEALNMGALPLNQLLNSEIVASVQDAVQQSSLYLAAFNFDKPVPFVAAGTQEPLDEGVWAFVLRCVSVRAEDRPSFSECSQELKQYLQAASTAVFVPPPRHAVSVAGVLRAADEAKYGYPVTAGLTGASSAAYAEDLRVGAEGVRSRT